MEMIEYLGLSNEPINKQNNIKIVGNNALSFDTIETGGGLTK